MAHRSRSHPGVNPTETVQRRLRNTLALLLAITLVGTLGFKFFSLDPEVTWIDCLYMTVTSMTTVGYGEIVRVGQAGRLFVIVFLTTGFLVVSYGAFEIGQWLFSTEMRNYLE